MLRGGAQETIYLQPPPHKPRRHCLSLGRLLRKLRSGKVGCKLPASSSGKRNQAFQSRRRQQLHLHMHLKGISSFRKG